MPLDHPTNSPLRSAAARAAHCAIDIVAIGRSTAIVGWTEIQDEPARRGFRAVKDGRPVPPPAAHCVLSIGDQRRHLLALPVASALLQQSRLEITALDGATVAAAERNGRDFQRPGLLDLLALSAELVAAERVRFLRFVLDVCPAILRLGRDPSFIELAHDLVGALADRPGPLAARCTAGSLVVLEGVARRGLGARLQGIVIGHSGIARLSVPPAELPHPKPAAGLARLAFAVEREHAASGAILAILGDGGIACRRLPTEVPPLTAFERAGRERGFDAPLRNFLVDALIATDASRTSSTPLIREIRAATAKLRPRPATGAVRGGIDLAVANRGGMLIAGWIDDPHGLTEGIDLVRRDRPVHVAQSALLRFRHAQADGDGRTASGFLCRVPAAVDGDLPASILIAARLGSGGSIPLGEGPSVIASHTLLTRILSVAAGASLEPSRVAAMLQPVIQQAAADQIEACALEFLDIGPVQRSGSTSVLVPVGGDREILHARFAHFALDPCLADIEIIHVVEDPRRADEIAAALRGLATLYGRGSRLAVAQRPNQMRTTLNAVVATIQSQHLALLAPDAMPETSGWLDALTHALDANPRAGLIAARSLNADDSLVDAGLMRVLEADGSSRFVTQLAGFPRHFPDGGEIPPAADVRGVAPPPALPGAEQLVAHEAESQRAADGQEQVDLPGHREAMG